MNRIQINGKDIQAPEGSIVQIVDNRVMINGVEWTEATPAFLGPKVEVKISVQSGTLNVRTDSGNIIVLGNANEVRSSGDAEIRGEVKGDVEAKGDVRAGNIGYDATAGGDICCGDVGGSLSAGGDVKCGSVIGNIMAAGDVCHRG